MGFKDFLNKQIDKQVEKGNAQKNFEKNIQDLSIPMDRIINLNPERQELEWFDAVTLYESEYAKLRFQYGWKLVKGWDFDRDKGSRFDPVRWQVGETIVEAKYLTDEDGMHVGVVQEKVIKRG